VGREARRLPASSEQPLTIDVTPAQQASLGAELLLKAAEMSEEDDIEVATAQMERAFHDLLRSVGRQHGARRVRVCAGDCRDICARG
jgi:hypothetical protein